MNTADIIHGLENLYEKFLANGEFFKAQECLLEISKLKGQTESKDSPGENLLLG